MSGTLLEAKMKTLSFRGIPERGFFGQKMRKLFEILFGALLCLISVGCQNGSTMTDKEVNALKHPGTGPMPKEAIDAMKSGKSKAAGAAYGLPGQ